jgi:uncharacterized membrane-anchored protein YjiN (DUF445 family)
VRQLTESKHISAPIPDEAEKRRALRKMKLVALSFLIGAAVVFLIMSLWPGEPAWTGYVKAAAEAGMVGALADWFAVTALFRHPMGIRIPHTAIIPTRKDAIGNSLGDFVGANFLSEQVVRERLRRVGVASRLGGWVAEPANAERVTAELATVVRGVVAVLRDEDVQAVMEQAVVKRVVAVPWGPPLGKLLAGVFADGSHHKLVDLICDRAYDWVKDNHPAVMRVVSDRAPSWSPKFVDSMVADKVYGEVLSFAWLVKTDPNHPMRLAVDKFLAEFAADLQTDPALMDRAEAVKHQVLAHPEVQNVERAAQAGPRGPHQPGAAPHRRRRAARQGRQLGRGRGRVRGGQLPRRDHHADHRHRAALGRRGDVPQDRAAGGPRPAVHPDQRHGRRRTGWSGDLHGGSADSLRSLRRAAGTAASRGCWLGRPPVRGG